MLRWLVVGAALVAAAPASAAFGNGIRVGGSDGRLHPFLELELRYDSNVAAIYAPGVTTRPGDLILHVRPGLQLNVPGEAVAVDLRAALDWAQYFGIRDTAGAESTKDLSTLYANVSLGVGFNRHGQFGFEIDEKFARSNQPTAYSIASGVISNFNDLNLSAPWRPGGGALTVALGGSWSLESFEPFKSAVVCGPASANPFCDSQYLSKLGYSTYGASLGLNWKFLPKTATLLDLSWFKRVPNSDLYSISGSGMRAQVGVSGLVTNHLAATVKAGYGTTLSLSPATGTTAAASVSNYGTWLALLSAEWIPTAASSLKLTWNHDFGIDPGTTWAIYSANHVTLDAKSRLNSLLSVAFTADLTMLAYRDAANTTATIITARPSVQADVTRWAMLELSYQFTDRTTNADATVAPPGWKFSRHEIWLRGVVTY